MRRALLLTATLWLECTPFTGSGEPPALDGGVSPGPPAAASNIADAQTTGDGATSPPTPGTSWCTGKNATWCFDFEGSTPHLWRNKTWEDNPKYPGRLKVEGGTASSIIAPWTSGSPPPANVFLDARFKQTLSFEWQFHPIVQGKNGQHTLIAELLDGTTEVYVYAAGSRILIKQGKTTDLKEVAQPKTYPTQFKLTLRTDQQIVLLDVSMGDASLITSHPLDDWNKDTTRVGFGIGQVGGSADDEGRHYRYDNVIVETE